MVQVGDVPRTRSVLVPCVVTAMVGTAHAQPGNPPAPVPSPVYPQPAPAPPPERTLSLTISPVHLPLPVVELTGEFRAAPRLGVAGVGGVGKIEAMTGTTTTRFFAFEVGGSLRYYVTGSFQQGLQLGAEVLYVHVALDDSTGPFTKTPGVADGLSIGPFIGYKWIARSGVTFDGQLGVAYAATHTEPTVGAQTTLQKTNTYPLLNLNIGWSL